MPESKKPAGELAATVNWRDKTITLPAGTIAMIVSILLGAGGGKFASDLFGADQEVLDRIAAIEMRLDAFESGQAETKKVIDETFEIVNAAHPPRGRVGIPDSENP